MVTEALDQSRIHERSPARRSTRCLGFDRRSLFAYGLLAPSLLFLLLFTYLPILSVGWGSLHHTRHGERIEHFVGLGNFTRALADEAFRTAVFNNLLYAVATIAPSLALALVFAVGLERSTRLAAGLRTILFLPSLVPMVAAAALFSFIFMPRIGLLDHYLARLGMGATNWIGDPDIALWSLAALSVWKNAGYYMLFYLAGLQSLPREVYEAAAIEGANAWQRFWYVTLPLLKPTTAFVLVIALINVLTQVDHVIVLTKGGPSNSTNLVLFYIYQEAHENFDHGKAAAATLLSVVVLLAISFVSLKSLEHGFRHEG
jgi:sn-glycerol 3-phosphate transport system permease protein